MGELICGLQEEQVEQLTAEKLATEQCAAEQDAAGAYGGECGAAACAGRRGGGGRAAGCLVGDSVSEREQTHALLEEINLVQTGYGSLT